MVREVWTHGVTQNVSIIKTFPLRLKMVRGVWSDSKCRVGVLLSGLFSAELSLDRYWQELSPERHQWELRSRGWGGGRLV